MRIKSKRLVAAAAGLLACTISSRAMATLVYSTNFNTPTYSDAALVNNGSATDTTTPGQDGWLNTSAGLTNNIPVVNTATNGIVTLTTSGQDARHPFTTPLINSGSAYLDADITVSAAQATGDYFLHLGDGGTSNFFARTHIKSSGTGFVMGVGTGAGTPTYGATDLVFGTPYHLLVRYDFVAGAANDTGALFINPTTTDGSGDTAYVAMTTIGSDATSLNGVYLRQGTAGNAATLSRVDNITVNGTIPEPASLGVLALGGLVLGRRRRA